jgi:hypothetical protein
MQTSKNEWNLRLGLSHTGIPNHKLYVIKVIDDDGFMNMQYFEYDNAVDAVNAYNKFVDIGTAEERRLVFLIEANETVHKKEFHRGIHPATL